MKLSLKKLIYLNFASSLTEYRKYFQMIRKNHIFSEIINWYADHFENIEFRSEIRQNFYSTYHRK